MNHQFTRTGRSMAPLILVMLLACIGGPVFILFFLYLFFYTQYYWISLLYLSWVIYDRDSRHVGHKGTSVRDWTFWKKAASYFPIKLVKTADIDPQYKYLFVIVPHGVLSIGTLAAFGTFSLKFYEVFPGIIPHFVLQSLFFWFPIVRDILIHCGNISSSEKSLDRVLSSSRGGDATCLVVGGASEALYAAPGSYRTIIRRRTGYARLALKHGASLVPVISFGETDLFDRMDHLQWPWFKWFAYKVHILFGFYPAFPCGKTFLIPHQVPISVVVGSPIKVRQIPEPTPENIEETKEEFIRNLVELFEKEKSKYIRDHKNTFLEIL